MTIFLIILGAMWSLGCVGLPLWGSVQMFRDYSPGMGTALLLLGVPLGVFCAILPWAFAADMASPDLVTLKKGEWACSSSHTETSLMPVPAGRTTVLIPTTRTVCDAYSRIK